MIENELLMHKVHLEKLFSNSLVNQTYVFLRRGLDEEEEMLLSGQGTVQIEDIFSNQIIEEISCDSQASFVPANERHKPRNIIHMSNFSQTVHSRKPEERSP